MLSIKIYDNPNTEIKDNIINEYLKILLLADKIKLPRIAKIKIAKIADKAKIIIGTVMSSVTINNKNSIIKKYNPTEPNFKSLFFDKLVLKMIAIPTVAKIKRIK
jgi:hypothetical protein